MKRTLTRRLWVSSLLAVGAAASASACSSADPTLPTDPNPVIVTSFNPPPVSGGTLLVTKDGVAVAADPDRDLMWVVDLTTQKVSSVALQTGDEPGRLDLDLAGRAHVALRGAGAIATIDLASLAVVDRTPVCSAPRGVAYDPAADKVHVACAGGELVTLAASGGAPIATQRFADRDLEDVLVQGDHLVLTRFRAAELLVLDASGALQNRQTPASADPTGFGNEFSPTVAWRTLSIATGGFAMVHQLAATAPVVISQPGGYGDTGDAQGNGCSTTIVQSAISEFAQDGTLDGQGLGPPALNGISVPVDLASDGWNTYVVASAGSDTLAFVSANTISPGNPCSSTTPAAMPGQPVAVAFSAKFNTFVAQVRELAQPNQGAALVVLNPAGAVQTIIKLTDATVANTGHSLFHHNASATSTLACASCHPQGHEDGHVWTFDTLGQRRTQTVSGGVLETAPLHWNGDMTGLPDIMHEVFEVRMGGPEQGPRHIAAFADWLNAIPAHPASPTGAASQIAAGKALFESAAVGCTSCHNGAHFTNNQTVDVGTGQPFQVPTLRGVAARRPYMHDGCAATLQDRFDPNQASCNGGDTHGHTSQLSQTDVANLIAYLETL